MSVKNTLKRLIKTVDEALLADAEAPQFPEPSSASPDDLTDQPNALVTVSPLSTLMAPGKTIMTPVEFHDAIIAPKYVQINSPHRIEPALLEPFEQGMKEVTVVFVQNRHVIQGTFEAIHDTHLVVRTQHSTYFRKRGEVVLILIPISAEQRYVLQLTVEEIYAHRLMLRYQDPRYDVRRQIRFVSPIELRLPPPTLLTALRQRQARILRQTTLPPAAALNTSPGKIVDQLYELDATAPSPLMQILQQATPLQCYLQDFSLGGFCLTLPDGLPDDSLAHRLVSLRVALPVVTIHSVERQYLPLHLHLFSAVRSTGSLSQPPTIHVRFLQRLPEEIAPYLADLERRCVELQHPLS